MRSVVECWSYSAAGRQPGRENEDFADYLPRAGAASPEWADFAAVVADGVGSSEAPADAAQTAARSWLVHARAKFIENGAECAGFNELHFNEVTSHAFLQAHEAVQKESKGSACAAAACLQGDLLLVGNVGDCRAYRINSRAVEQVSADQVDAAGDPTDVVGGRRAPRVHATARTRVQPGDVIVLCTDGVWKLMEPQEMRKAAVGDSAKEIGLNMQSLVDRRRRPDSDDATFVVALIKQVGRPFWEADTKPMEYRLKDDSMDERISGVLAELLNRARGPLEKENAKAEQVLEQMNAAARDLRTAARELDGVAAEISASAKRSNSTRRAPGPANSMLAVLALTAVVVVLALTWFFGGRQSATKAYELRPILPKDARVTSQTYTDDRLLVKYKDQEGRPMMAVFRVQDGGNPYAVIDLSTGEGSGPGSRAGSTTGPSPSPPEKK